MDLFDVEVAERVEGELDRIAEKRAREARDANAIEALWAEQERRERERRREERRQEWCDFHRHMERLHAALCEEHRAKAAALLNGEGAS